MDSFSPASKQKQHGEEMIMGDENECICLNDAPSQFQGTSQGGRYGERQHSLGN
jgi:hypothetical protein